MKNTSYWIIKISLITFVLSVAISLVSSLVVENLKQLVPAILILLLVIFIGIVFDLVGVAVTVAGSGELNAMASKRIRGAKTALLLHKDSARIANICADVIGDICGVLSGSLGTMIALKIMDSYGIGFNLEIIVSGLIAALTVGGKAYTKVIAREKANEVVLTCARIIEKFTFTKKK